MRTTNLVAGVVVLLGSALLLAWIIPDYTAAPQSRFDVPPARVPSITIWTCLIMAVILVLGALRASPSGPFLDDDEFGDAATGVGVGELLHIVILAGVTLAVALALPVVGFEITMGVLLLATMAYLGLRNYVVMLAVAVVVPVGLSQLVWRVFSVEFP